MTGRSRVAFLLGLSVLVSCENAAAPDPSPVAGGPGAGVQTNITGSYTANVAVPPGVIIASYELSGRVHKNGETRGNFTFFADTPTGTIDFAASIVCLAVDDALGRAWIGATITANGSTRATHQLAIHQVGEPVWFRVADRGAGGSGDADRTTSLGFKGSLGILTSPEYCAARLWGNDGIAIGSGNLTIH